MLLRALYSYLEDPHICMNKNLFLKISTFFLLIASAYPSFSQNNDYFLKSSDNEVAIEVSRGAEGIEIALLFTKASQFEYVTIEKSADSQNNFSQCKYIKFNESANDSVVIVKRDVYPLNASDDVYYRVKTITKEGVSRVYPAVRLPGLHDTKKQK